MRRKKYRWITFASVAVLLLCLAGTFWPRKPSLFNRAIPVSSTPEWLARYRNSEQPDAYQWVLPDEILFFVERIGHLEAFRQKILPDGRAFPPVSVGKIPAHGMVSHISPDGKWALQRVRSARRLHTWYVDALNGSGKSAIFDTWGYTVAWMPDSARLITIVNGYNPAVQVFTIANQKVKTSTVPQRNNLGELVGCTPEGQALASIGYSIHGNTASYELTRFDPESPQTTLHSQHLHSPSTEPDADFLLAPSVNRLLWQARTIHYPRSLLFRVWLEKLGFPRSRSHPYQNFKIVEELSYRVSDLEGKEVRELGRLVRALEEPLPDFQWTRDEKRLSFIRDDTLYLLPID